MTVDNRTTSEASSNDGRNGPDVRLNNVSQLASFTKKGDLRYFLKAICDIEYVHLPELAPTVEILHVYKKEKNGDWELYERRFLDLMRSRQIENTARDLRRRLLAMQ